jgi:hypothetical protein
MANYKSFIHVIRMDKTKLDVTSFLNGTIYCFSKLDGTNAVAWADNDGNIHCGSRKREVSIDHDNADFMLFFTTDKSTEKLREFLIQNPNLIVYGEWLNGWSGRKQAGTIKQYLDPGFWVIGVFDIDAGNYLYYDIYSELLEDIYDKIDRPIAILDHPSYEEITKLLDNNHFNLPNDINGEGIVYWNYDFRDDRGNFQVAKIVTNEFHEKKGSSQKIKDPQLRAGLEQNIVDAFITSADCEKCRQKVMLNIGLDEWDNSGKAIGMFLNMLYTDLIEEEMLSIVRRFKNPVIDFSILKNICFNKGRSYLGLI